MIELPVNLEANAIATDAVMTSGVVELIKRTGFPDRLAGVLALFIAIGFGLMRFGITPPALFQGVISALAATGVYEMATNGKQILSPATEPEAPRE